MEDTLKSNPMRKGYIVFVQCNNKVEHLSGIIGQRLLGNNSDLYKNLNLT